MFKFGFNIEEPEVFESEGSGNVFNKDETKYEELNNENTKIEWYSSEEVLPTEDHLENLNLCALNSTSVTYKGIEVHYIHSGSMIHIIGKNNSNDDGDFKFELTDIKSAESKHSDLIPGIYEGGAKIWECTIDIIHYITDNKQTIDFKEKFVLDLGCGSGLLGIYALKCGASVHFQDYNKDVLEALTIPNVLLNYESPSLADIKRHKFYSGDWSKYLESTKNSQPKFDYIFTSETIYNPENQQKLLDTIAGKLSQTGTVFLGAKSHYFGVGGGIRQFEDLIKKDNRFNTEVVWSSSEGVNREILKMNWK